MDSMRALLGASCSGHEAKMEPTDWESDVSGDSIDFIDEFCNDDLPESIRPLLGDPYFLQEVCALAPFLQLRDEILLV